MHLLTSSPPPFILSTSHMSLVLTHPNFFKSLSKPSFYNPCRPSNPISIPSSQSNLHPRPNPNRITISLPKASPKPLQQNTSFSLSSAFKLLLLLLLHSLIFYAAIVSLRLLPPNFSQRWCRLLAHSQEAEAMVAHLPSHLWQAVVACEDNRFFSHFGIDPIGVSRAILLFPDGGGGSTITQQLVKNVFLKHERKFSRKVIEMVLALLLERKLSKWKILCSYLSKIYWGHGVYGIEAASSFYFGKPPSVLTLAESAMLAGIIPSPERRSPFREPSRGKISQAKALRKMVDAGLLDIDLAMLLLKQPLCLRVDDPKPEDRPSCSQHIKSEEVEGSTEQRGKISAATEIWDWEKASAVWEAREYMEKWAQRIRIRNALFTPIKTRNVSFLSFRKLN